MEPHMIQIRDQQRQTWDKFSAGWKKWDELVMNWIGPVGDTLFATHSSRMPGTCLTWPPARASRV